MLTPRSWRYCGRITRGSETHWSHYATKSHSSAKWREILKVVLLISSPRYDEDVNKDAVPIARQEVFIVPGICVNNEVA